MCLARLSLLSLTSCLLALPLGAQHAPASEAGYDWQIERLADGVWAALQPHARRFDESNATIVAGERGVLVVDAQDTPAAVDALIRQVRRLTGQPVRYLVNTHWHADHVGGNQRWLDAFPEAITIGHETLTADVPGRAQAEMAERRERLEQVLPAAREQLVTRKKRDGGLMTDEELARQTEVVEQAAEWLERHRGVTYLPPEVGHRGGLRIDLGSRTVELLAVRAHTRSDTIVWLPEDGILIAGDVIDDLPYVGHAFPRSWIAALERLDELAFGGSLRAEGTVRIVPGHGPVFAGPDQLRRVRGYLTALVQEAERAVAEERELEEWLDSAEPQERLAAWRTRLAGGDQAALRFFDGTVREALERAYRDVRGELDD